MGSSKKAKDKDKEHKHKKKKRSRSKSKDRSEKKRRHKEKKKHRHRSRSPLGAGEDYERSRSPYNEQIPGLAGYDRREEPSRPYETYDGYEGYGNGNRNDWNNQPQHSQQSRYDQYNQQSRYDQHSQQSRYDQHGQQPRYDQHSQQSRYDQPPQSQQSRYDQPPQQSRYEEFAYEPPPDIKPKHEVPQDIYDAPAGGSSGGGEISLSIEETNKLREKLGLKPLDVPGSKEDEETKSKKEDVHAPPVNLSDVKKGKDIREKLLAAKEKRRINKMLGKVKTLGDSDSEGEGGALAWVKKSRKMQKEKALAEKRAKMLEEMDQEFGIGNLVEEAFGKKKEYGSKDLTGIRVEHDQSQFKEGRSVILTLQDKGVLDEEGQDTLENVNILDLERSEKYKENKLKKPDYNPYDDNEFNEYGMLKVKDVLSKYDEEIHGKKKESFMLGRGGKYDTIQERREMEIRAALQQQGEALVLPEPQMASEFYTPEEMQSFKKVKKKIRKIRKKPKAVTADDLVPLGNEDGTGDMGNRNSRRRRREQEDGEVDMDVEIKTEPGPQIPGLDIMEVKLEEQDDEDDYVGPTEDLTGVGVEDEAALDLENQLSKARKIKQKKSRPKFEEIAEKLETIKKEEESDMEMDSDNELTFKSNNIMLNETSEFCRSLGEITNYGQAGNRIEDEDELLDFERELAEERRRQMEEDDVNNPGWQQVEVDNQPVEIIGDEKAALDDEPVVNAGLGAALQLAQKKGYLQEEAAKKVSAPRHVIEAKNYSIEDKRYDDLDEKSRKRDRFGGGMVQDFREKDSYKPDVKLEYVDDSGRVMSSKEAFRYLSHRFHGKGSGKLKTEKRKKKIEEEQLMKSMSSSDTPLGTASMLETKLEQEKTPFLVLSGGSKTLTSGATIVKQ